MQEKNNGKINGSSEPTLLVLYSAVNVHVFQQLDVQHPVRIRTRLEIFCSITLPKHVPFFLHIIYANNPRDRMNPPISNTGHLIS